MLSSKLIIAGSGTARSLSCKQVRTICHKSKLKAEKVYRWPYETRSYTRLTSLLDPRTKNKFNDNTKIIQVEGNVAAGKEEFARKLADELGMVYFPQVDLENLYINRSGYDYRALNPLLPERLRACDMEMFHENPTRHSVIHMQYNLFKMRLFQFFKVLQHIFNTGQGVVLTRSVFTERVFVEAMHELGWLPMGYLRGDGVRFYDWKVRYLYTRNLVLTSVPRPHLTVYLDTPVDTCLERIKNDPNPTVANSKALSREFLEGIENAYKNVVLPKQDFNGLVLNVDHPEHKTHDEIMDVVDDIEKLDFTYDHHDSRFEEWNPFFAFWHHDFRRLYTSDRVLKFADKLIQPYYDIAGMGDSITDGDIKLKRALIENHVRPFWKHEFDADRYGYISSYFGFLNLGQYMDKSMRCDYW